MEFTSILFYVFSAVLVLASLQVITTRIRCTALFLVLAFFNAAGIWMLLKADSYRLSWFWFMLAL
jgi:NADH-quinone oxidoreductase subunit J